MRQFPVSAFPDKRSGHLRRRSGQDGIRGLGFLLRSILGQALTRLRRSTLSLGSDDAWAIARLDGHDQAALVRDGTLSPEDLVEAAIQRIEELDPKLNALSHAAFDRARAMARTVDRHGPMAAVPYLLKASIAYPGFPQTSCSRARRGVIADRAYPFTVRLDEAGLVPVGMSSMPEFGLLCSGESLLTGPTLNPWDPSRNAGGSSTGAAVAVAAGLVPLAHASDAAGSIRLPASHCGVVGFKPSRGWNVRARAHHLIDDLLCSDAMLGRSTRDVAWAARLERPFGLPTAAEPHRRLRIAVDLTGLSGNRADAEVSHLIERTAALCSALGHEVQAVAMPIARPAAGDAILILWPYVAGEIVDYYASHLPDAVLEDLLEPWTIGLAERREAITPTELGRAYEAIAASGNALAAFHQDWDVVLCPATRSAPLQLGALGPERPFDELWAATFEHVDFTPLHNLTGVPALSLPLGMSDDGLPVGSHFSAAHGGDETLLALAAQLETASPWAHRWPPMSPLGNAEAGAARS
jgi:amidase